MWVKASVYYKLFKLTLITIYFQGYRECTEWDVRQSLSLHPRGLRLCHLPCHGRMGELAYHVGRLRRSPAVGTLHSWHYYCK